MNTVKMKQNANVVIFLVLAYLLVINVLIYFLDYKLHPINYIAFMAFYIIVAVFSVVLSLKFKNVRTKLSKTFGTLMPLIAIIYVFSLGFTLELNTFTIHYNAIYFEVLFAITAVSSLIILFTSIKSRATMVIMGILTVLFCIPFAIIIYFSLIFCDFGSNKIVQTINSPDGVYSAWVVNSDQGALGGDTCVYVRNINNDIFFGFGTLESREKQIEFGKFNESYELKWDANDILTVNGTEYNIPDID